MRIVIIDYGMGNLRSIKKRLEMIGVRAKISSDHKVIEKADKLILPGVGHFAKGMRNLNRNSLFDILGKTVLNRKKPILGICLGMQLFSQFSEEGNQKGLSWLESKVEKFDFKRNENLRVPHVGWNNIRILKKSILLKNIRDGEQFYFTHSYFMNNIDAEYAVAATNYGKEFVSIVENENIYGVQFHPEKSRFLGLQLIKNFIDYS